MTQDQPKSRSEQGLPWTFEKIRTRTVVRDYNGSLLFIIEGPMDSHAEACAAAIETMKAALSVRSERPFIPEGWKLVPIQPTSAMIAAARMSRPYREDDGDEGPMDINSAATWETMVAAAPSNERKGEG